MVCHRFLWCVVVWLSSLPVSGLPFSQLLLAVSQAQITLDGSLGPQGPLSGPDYTIGADVGQLQGDNLFHSFGEFNVQTGESATFTGPDTVDNVIGRVTGGNASFIDGPLRSEIPDANLYLLNPSGVLFGENASLDVQGSFHVSTADYLKLADGERFSAHLGNGSVLSAAPPEAFGFLGENPVARISIDGSALQVPAGEILSVVGGDLEIGGRGPPAFDAEGNVIVPPPTLSAPGGRIYLASVASAGEVIPHALNQAPGLSVDTVEHLGEIQIARGGVIATSGDGGGTVVIRAGRLRMETAALFADTLGERDGAALGIDLEVAGELRINRAAISSRALGSGRGGSILVRAQDVVLERAGGGFFTGIITQTSTAAAAGDLTVEAGRLEVRNGAQINTGTLATGAGGTLVVRAQDIVIDGAGIDLLTGITTLTQAGGVAGDLIVEAGRLEVRNGAEIGASTFGEGTGGNLRVTATEIVLDAGLIAAFSPIPQAEAGRSGAIVIQAQSLLLRNDSTVSVETARAAAGNIELEIGQQVVLRDQSRITTSVAGGQGDGGNIQIRQTGAGEPTPFVVLDDSAIIAQAVEGRGGNIAIAAEVFLTSPASVVSASSELGVDGRVNVSSPVSDISGTFAPLPEVFLQATALLSECAKRQEEGRQEGKYSSFTIARWRHLEPDDVLPSDFSVPEQPRHHPVGHEHSPHDQLAAPVVRVRVDGQGAMWLKGQPTSAFARALELRCGHWAKEGVQTHQPTR